MTEHVLKDDGTFLLRIQGLRLRFDTYGGTVKALEDVELEIRPGETLGLVGESGCGKSVTALSVMRLVPQPPGRYERGRVLLSLPIPARPLPGAPAERPAVGHAGSLEEAFVGAILSRLDLSGRATLRTGRPTWDERRSARLVARAALFAEGVEDPEAWMTRAPGSLSANERGVAERALARAVVPQPRYVVDLVRLSEAEMQRIRGNDVSMIFQEPMTSLNPVIRVGDQIMEALLRHQSLGVDLSTLDRLLERRGVRTRRVRERQHRAREIATKMLATIGIPDPSQMLGRYPHELSGGMRQRVMIAMALATNPSLLIADEPTTALDVTIQAQIMELMKDLKKRMGTSILLITHHLGVVAEMCDRVSVMYAGSVVETAPTRNVFKTPKHPYTVSLLRSIPDLSKRSDVDLPTITGTVPDLLRPPSGCRFHPRCPFAFAKCSDDVPPLTEVGKGHHVACHLYSTPGVTPPVDLQTRTLVPTEKEAARA